jgi:hypothetical protein
MFDRRPKAVVLLVVVASAIASCGGKSGTSLSLAVCRDFESLSPDSANPSVLQQISAKAANAAKKDARGASTDQIIVSTVALLMQNLRIYQSSQYLDSSQPESSFAKAFSQANDQVDSGCSSLGLKP